jgi:protein-tyrosine kinase
MLAPAAPDNDTAAADAEAALWEFPEESDPQATGSAITPASRTPDLETPIVQIRPAEVVPPVIVAAAPPEVVLPADTITELVAASEPEPAIVAVAAPEPAPRVSPPVAPVVVAPAVDVDVDDDADVDEDDDAPMPAVVPSRLRRLTNDTLITATHRKDAVEQYRKMAATLHHVQANRNVRVVLCTSAVMAEGKTVTAANLALTLSDSYQRRVLLIDADLRRPRLHSLLGVPNEQGLYEALRAPLDRKVHHVAVSPLLSLVTAGRPGPDPVGALTSERLARVIEDAGASFDWVIIDTPPVLVLPDAGLLMGVVDAAVLVVGAGQTTYRMVKRAAEALGRDRIIGVVMNRAQDSVLQEGYGQYYGYYETAGRPE